MNNCAYFIQDFETNIPGYSLDRRDIWYTEKDMLKNLKYLLIDIYEEYRENDNIRYNDFYNKFNISFKISVISLNHQYMTCIDDYKNSIKNINRENLLEYLINFTDTCILVFDQNLNLKDTYCYCIINTSYQFSFSYKALFPNKYHVEKYKPGDKVIYGGEEYIIIRRINEISNIFESDNPLNYLYGYVLGTNDGYILNDDRFCYFPVDEDLISV